eukprot:CAMPEP_0176437756 /NCGR_PEP_ID=MMETSP0127-20121128/18833_1 /TAXON_ID=938130 /ORGANISM="Platyophrya macrostoma, Strain WH" /LENGTH=505 /DNA_ID=CAMNT_0017821487 /DNA_START=1 /DNA_END=1518 /DNA_ORIENTATION=-
MPPAAAAASSTAAAQQRQSAATSFLLQQKAPGEDDGEDLLFRRFWSQPWSSSDSKQRRQSEGATWQPRPDGEGSVLYKKLFLNRDCTSSPSASDDTAHLRSCTPNVTPGVAKKWIAKAETSVAPIEIPSQPVTRDFLPAEVLRRVLREEAGTSIIGRRVSLRCILQRKKQKSPVAPSQPSPPASSSDSTLLVPPAATVLPSSIAAAGDAVSSPTVSPGDIRDAVVVGDATIEAAEESKPEDLIVAEENAVGSCDRPATTFVDGMSVEENVTSESSEGSLLGELQSAKEDDDAVVDDGGLMLPDSVRDAVSELGTLMEAAQELDDAEAEAAGSVGSRQEVRPSSLASAPPVLKDGTVIPLSSHFVTRSERMTRSPEWFTKPTIQMVMRTASTEATLVAVHPSSSSSSTSSSPSSVPMTPPLRDVAAYHTIVAVKVVHNERATLEGAVQELEAIEERGGGAAIAEHKKLDSIRLHTERTTDEPSPRIMVFIADDTETFDFHKILFEE